MHQIRKKRDTTGQNCKENLKDHRGNTNEISTDLRCNEDTIQFPLRRRRKTEKTKRLRTFLYNNTQEFWRGREVTKEIHEEVSLELIKKSTLIFYRWWFIATSYNRCLFCHDEIIPTKRNTGQCVFFCLSCYDRIQNGMCVNCGEDIPPGVLMFCPECLERIDFNRMVESFGKFVRETDREILSKHAILTLEKHILSKVYHSSSELKKCLFCGKNIDSTTNSCPFHPPRRKREDPCMGCGTQIPDKPIYYEFCNKCLNKYIMETREFKSKPEKQLFEVVSTLYPNDIILTNVSPFWLKVSVDPKDKLELDIYIPTQRLSFEYDGREHYEFIPFFHGNESGFICQQERDRRKDRICLQCGVDLIRFRYDEKINSKSISEKIKEKRNLLSLK